ncbi:hypothetical protein DXB00_11590 [Butyricicoccus sp. OF10-2]|nr:hypothetical protein DXB00_11590 [Butyricicoccus sp. OF10-2]
MTEISCTGFAGCPNRVSGLQFPGEDIAASAAGTKRKIHKKEETVGSSFLCACGNTLRPERAYRCAVHVHRKASAEKNRRRSANPLRNS